MLFVSVVSGVYAQRPEPVGAGSLTIVSPEINVYRARDSPNYSIHFHVVNSSFLLENASRVNCFIHVYNENNSHLVISPLSADSNGADLYISLNLSRVGVYTYNVFSNGTSSTYLPGGYSAGYLS